MPKNTSLPKSHITPWTLRIFNVLPGNPALIGVSFSAVLLVVFAVGRVLFDGGANSTAGDFRLAIIHILLMAYSASAYTYLLTATTKAVRDLTPVVKPAPDQQAIIDQVGKHLWWGLMLAGFVGILIYVYGTNITTTDSDPWDWQQNSYDALWMRILGPFFSWWASCLLYVLVVESFRLSKLSDGITSLDLLDLQPYKPLIRQGLTNALLVIGMSSVFSLFLLEPGYALLMLQILTVFAVFAWIGLMLPLRGIRRKISIAKEEELDWCRQALISTRDKQKSNAADQQSFVEITAYKGVVEDVRNWPFDSPTLSRFALYLLIPIGSVIGGALVERVLEFLLP